MSFPKNVRKSAAFPIAAMALGIASCQTTETVDNSTGPQLVDFSIPILSAQLVPDSASWEAKRASGDAHLAAVEGSQDIRYSIKFQMESKLGSDTLRLRLWRCGMLTASPTFLMEDDGFAILASNRDPIASAILMELDKLNLGSPKAFPLFADSSIAKAMARLVVDGDSLFMHWETNHPEGIDTARMRREALIYMASKNQSLASLATTSFLGMNAAQARAALQTLVPAFVPASAMEILFPLPPVRVESPIHLVGDLYSDSSAIEVHGRFAAKNRLYSPSLRVFKDGVEDGVHFSFQQTALPNPTTTVWDLDSNGGVTVRAFGNAPTGTYSLHVEMSDGTYFDSSSTTFRILPKPDLTGPSLSRSWPASDPILEFKDSTVLIRVEASDTSGVASVTLDGRNLTKTDSGYEILGIVPSTGTWTEFVIKALDGKGNQSSISIRAQRKSSGTSQILATPVDPATRTGDTIPSEQTIRHIAWKLSDPVGIKPGTVLINLTPAKFDSADSTWSAEVAIPPTGKAVSVQIQAINQSNNGLVDSVVVVRRKDSKGPSISAIPELGTRPLFFDSAAARVAWKVSDNLKIDSVWINGIQQALRTDSAYSFDFEHLLVGRNVARIRAKDSTGNVSIDSLIVTRMPNTTPPTLVKLYGLGDQPLAYGTDSVLVRWKAGGNDRIDSVTINGIRALAAHDTFYLNLPLEPGRIPVVARAWNSSPNPARDSITLDVRLKDKDSRFYSIRRMPDGRIWMTQNLSTNPSIGAASCARGDCANYGVLYTWAQAIGADSASSAPVGICPSGWHIPTRAEWSALFQSTAPAGSTDSAVALKTTSGWAAVVSSGGLKFKSEPTNGTDMYDGFLTPNMSGTILGALSGTAGFWLPGGFGLTTGSAIVFNQTPVASDFGKTATAGVRCIETRLRIRQPIKILDPDLGTKILQPNF